jgi:predicted metallopeptidase
MEEKEYEVMDDANAIIKQLAERYPEVLWAVKPDEIVVMGVTNKEAPKGNRTKAKITRIPPLYKALINYVGDTDVKYMIEVYCSEYGSWSAAQKQGVLFHEMLHIPRPDEKGLLKHDVEDQAVVLDALGIDWFRRSDLPSLLEGDPIPFRKDLALRLHNLEKNEDSPNIPNE